MGDEQPSGAAPESAPPANGVPSCDTSDLVAGRFHWAGISVVAPEGAELADPIDAGAGEQCVREVLIGLDNNDRHYFMGWWQGPHADLGAAASVIARDVLEGDGLDTEIQGVRSVTLGAVNGRFQNVLVSPADGGERTVYSIVVTERDGWVAFVSRRSYASAWYPEDALDRTLKSVRLDS